MEFQPICCPWFWDVYPTAEAIFLLGPQSPLGVCLGLGVEEGGPGMGSASLLLFMLGSGEYFMGGEISTAKNSFKKTHCITTLCPLGLEFLNVALSYPYGSCPQCFTPSSSAHQVTPVREGKLTVLSGAVGLADMWHLLIFLDMLFPLLLDITKHGNVYVGPLSFLK